MELRHIRVFVALAEELHFGRTAQRLHLTQPAVSGQLQQLEAALGVQLIHRGARQVSLTEVGVAFLRDARRMLDQARAAQAGVERFQAGRADRLRVGYLADAMPARLPVLLRSVAREHPATELVLRTGEPHTLLDEVRNDVLDVALVALPAPVAGLRVTSVGFDPAVAAVASNLDRDDVAPLALLAEQRLLALPRRRNPAFYDSLVAALLTAGLPGPLTETGATSVESLLIEVACGAGHALVPESAIVRLQVAGVSFRRISDAPGAGCRIAAVSAAQGAGAPLASLLARLPTAVRELSLQAA